MPQPEDVWDDLEKSGFGEYIILMFSDIKDILDLLNDVLSQANLSKLGAS